MNPGRVRETRNCAWDDEIEQLDELHWAAACGKRGQLQIMRENICSSVGFWITKIVVMRGIYIDTGDGYY